MCVFVLQHSPNYHEEKQRCEYLHNKLAHIKRLIADFDQRRAQSWCWGHSTARPHWSVLRKECGTRRGCPTGWYLLTPLQLLPPPQPPTTTITTTSLPSPIILFHSSLLFRPLIPPASLLPANLENLTLTLPPFFLLSFCFFSMSSCGTWHHWTSGRGCLHVWRGFGEKTSTLLTFLKDFFFRHKKKNKKSTFEHQKNIMYLRKKKERGRSIYFGTHSAKSPQMIYCLTFVENNAKKFTAGLMCIDFVKPFCTQDPLMSSHLAKMSLLPHFLSLHKKNCTG